MGGETHWRLLCKPQIFVALAGMLSAGTVAAQPPSPERVTFPSADGKTMLVGYVFAPARPGNARVPAVVMMRARRFFAEQLRR